MDVFYINSYATQAKKLNFSQKISRGKKSWFYWSLSFAILESLRGRSQGENPKKFLVENVRVGFFNIHLAAAIAN